MVQENHLKQTSIFEVSMLISRGVRVYNSFLAIVSFHHFYWSKFLCPKLPAWMLGPSIKPGIETTNDTDGFERLVLEMRILGMLYETKNLWKKIHISPPKTIPLQRIEHELQTNMTWWCVLMFFRKSFGWGGAFWGGSPTTSPTDF